MSDGQWASPISETLYPVEESWPVVMEPSATAPAPTLENDGDERSSGEPTVDGRAPGLYLSQATKTLLPEASPAGHRVGATGFGC